MFNFLNIFLYNFFWQLFVSDEDRTHHFFNWTPMFNFLNIFLYNFFWQLF